MGVFWGLTITSPKKAYTQKVSEAFHISMAALDSSSKGGKEPVSVFVQVDGSEFLMCTLHQGKIQQQTLDLNFGMGDEVGFYTKNEGVVHLTGYTEMPDEEDSEFEMEEDWEDDNAPVLQEADFKAGKKRSLGGGDAPQTKKARQLMQALEDEDDDDDGDEDWEEDDEEEDDHDDFEDESDEEEEEEPSPVMNSSSKKSAKKETPKAKGKETPKAKGKETPKAKGKESPKAKGDKPKLNGEKTPKSQKTPLGKQTTPQEKGGTSEKKSKKDKKENATPKKSVLKMGVVSEDIKQGHGPEATPGCSASVYYRGVLQGGKQFDACLTGKPFKFKLGKGQVIKGWDLGVSGMKVGGRRRITVPPSAGYGASRTGPIPPNSTLVFDVELKAVN